MLRFFGYKNCSSCQKAEKFLQEKKIAYTYIDITLNPPQKMEFKQFFANSGLPPKKFFNTSGEVYRDLGLKDQINSLTEEQMIELLATQGRLVKRPLITDGQRVTVGAQPETLSTWH